MPTHGAFSAILDDVPVITCPDEPQLRETGQGQCVYIVDGVEFDPQIDHTHVLEQLSYTLSGATIAESVSNGTETSLDGVEFNVGTTTVTWVVRDTEGNEDECSFMVSVEDNEPPQISGMPNNITQNTDAGECGAIVTWTEPTATDNCNVVSFTSTHNPNESFPAGETTVSYTATDAAGNETTESFTITITDTEAPVISGMPSNITQDTDAGECGAVATWTEPTATDNCNVVSFTSTHNPNESFPAGETTVSYTATDTAGNETTESFTITITDTEAPVISGMPSNITQDTDAGE
ncbi:MAG: HYR domain-containing protein, partial [Bacteroidales bacterium]